ncbi:hypothetical protein [Algoriphagus sediminis]|uniref:Uncharacterized protein n=1 Tax=Algoriphagus sediminis TaxID=3057113 RepID=A0ABT7YBG3_9BACT|nr:hypothetical protein [Algoriphagus sediminis]MDN3203786.1 hypothetical protein [Algoriphagus sediminis]
MRALNINRSVYLIFLIGAILASPVVSFGQVEPIEFEAFKTSSSVNSTDRDRFISLTEGVNTAVYVSNDEVYYEDPNSPSAIVSVDSDAYGKLSSVTDKNAVELIRVNLKGGNQLPSSDQIAQFPALKFILFQGPSVPVNLLSGSPTLQATLAYIIFRNVSND